MGFIEFTCSNTIVLFIEYLNSTISTDRQLNRIFYKAKKHSPQFLEVISEASQVGHHCNMVLTGDRTCFSGLLIHTVDVQPHASRHQRGVLMDH